MGEQADRDAGLSGASGSPDAVHVVLGTIGHIVVDDVRDTLDVDAARHDIGCHEQGMFT